MRSMGLLLALAAGLAAAEEPLSPLGLWRVDQAQSEPIYDRALARLEALGPRRKIGLAFALQRVAAVPAEPHDRPLDLILTEAGPRVPDITARATAPDARRGGDAA